MSSNNPLFPTTEDMVKEMISNMETDKTQASQTKNKKSIINVSKEGVALNKSSSLDKSRPSSRTETEDTVKPLNKIRSISSASLDDKDTKKQQPKQIKFKMTN